MSEETQNQETEKKTNMFGGEIPEIKKKKERPLRRIFITGIVAMLPLVVTIYILKFLYNLIVSNLKPLSNKLALAYNLDLPESLIGAATIVLFVLIVFLVGLLTRMYIGRLLISLMEKTVTSIPLANTIYSAIKQMIESFQSSTNNFEKVVLVNFPHKNIYCVGLVVRDSQKLLSDILGEPCYNVFVPTAPNPTSGFITVIPQSACKEMPITVEEGVKFIFSVGLINSKGFDATDVKDVKKL